MTVIISPADGEPIHDPTKDCDGRGTWGTDPYQDEINNDQTLYFQCDCERHESAMDI